MLNRHLNLHRHRDLKLTEQIQDERGVQAKEQIATHTKLLEVATDSDKNLETETVTE